MEDKYGLSDTPAWMGKMPEQKEVKVAGSAPHHLRSPARPGDVGYDLVMNEFCAISPGETRWVKTGVAIEMPPGMWCMILPRSSANKMQMFVQISTIDNGYRKELDVGLYNGGTVRRSIMEGERYAQLIFMQAVLPELMHVDKLSPTERGENGFGSTGK